MQNLQSFRRPGASFTMAWPPPGNPMTRHGLILLASARRGRRGSARWRSLSEIGGRAPCIRGRTAGSCSSRSGRFSGWVSACPAPRAGSGFVCCQARRCPADACGADSCVGNCRQWKRRYSCAHLRSFPLLVPCGCLARARSAAILWRSAGETTTSVVSSLGRDVLGFDSPATPRARYVRQWFPRSHWRTSGYSSHVRPSSRRPAACLPMRTGALLAFRICCPLYSAPSHPAGKCAPHCLKWKATPAATH